MAYFLKIIFVFKQLGTPQCLYIDQKITLGSNSLRMRESSLEDQILWRMEKGNLRQHSRM